MGITIASWQFDENRRQTRGRKSRQEEALQETRRKKKEDSGSIPENTLPNVNVETRSSGSGGHAPRTADYRCTRAFCEKIPAHRFPSPVLRHPLPRKAAIQAGGVIRYSWLNSCMEARIAVNAATNFGIGQTAYETRREYPRSLSLSLGL